MPRSHSTSQKRVVAQIKQLCCLGLGAHAIAPPLTRLLLRMIPAHSSSVFFSDETGELVNIYDENPALIEVGPIYVNEFHDRREADVWIGFKETFERGLVGMMVEELVKIDRRRGSEATCTTWFSGRSAATAACAWRCVMAGDRWEGSPSRAAKASTSSRSRTSISSYRSSRTFRTRSILRSAPRR